jgi:threonine/homoserine/homoserine lactone efflux protein
VGAAFWITTIVVVATPGTGVLYTVSAGLARGPRAAVVAAAGCTLGIVPHVLAAVTGLAAVLHTSATVFQLLKYLGASYLVYLAWRAWRDRTAMDVSSAAQAGDLQVIVRGVIVNLLNPKLTLFFVAFLPQFVGADAPLKSMLISSALFMATTVVVFVLYGLLAATMRRLVVERPNVMRWIRRSFAVTFLGLGLRLATADR